MKVLLDTCVWGGVRQALSDAGHDVVWTGDWDEDPGDDEILAQAYRESRVLVTLDAVAPLFCTVTCKHLDNPLRSLRFLHLFTFFHVPQRCRPDRYPGRRQVTSAGCSRQSRNRVPECWQQEDVATKKVAPPQPWERQGTGRLA